ncbi:hypothetical protein [Aquincola sp. J276]|uniref:hypothetical protein n=1 Tax=Aquincola sp. J276 TaxID=2898432 RepID=UPI002151D5F0|nr:hypothetical protein [Aquincola sp. J276]MCR5864643.1 hypothetical protein [Aquincola sp. J276]
MKKYSFFDPATGLFHRTAYEGPEAFVCVPEGFEKIEGHFDMHCQRVDLTGAEPVVVDYVPPAPADDQLQTWQWDSATRRWLSFPTLAALKAQRIASVQAEIDAQELQQARPQRDVLTALVAGLQPPPEAVLRLQEIEAAIVPLRARRAALEAATTETELTSAG